MYCSWSTNNPPYILDFSCFFWKGDHLIFNCSCNWTKLILPLRRFLVTSLKFKKKNYVLCNLFGYFFTSLNDVIRNLLHGNIVIVLYSLSKPLSQFIDSKLLVDKLHIKSCFWLIVVINNLYLITLLHFCTETNKNLAIVYLGLYNITREKNLNTFP